RARGGGAPRAVRNVTAGIISSKSPTLYSWRRAFSSLSPRPSRQFTHSSPSHHDSLSARFVSSGMVTATLYRHATGLLDYSRRARRRKARLPSAPSQDPPRSPSVDPRFIRSEHWFTSWDGTRLFYRAWRQPTPTGRVLVLFHRGHEHSGRWDDVVE